MRQRLWAVWGMATMLNLIVGLEVMGVSPVYAATCIADCSKPGTLTCSCNGREAECDASDCIGCGASDADGCSVSKTCQVC